MALLLPTSELPTANSIADDADVELRALVTALADVVLVLDRDGYYRKVEPSALGRLARPPEELIGHSLHEIFPREQADHFLSLVRRALDTTERVEAEYAITIAGEIYWFSCVVIPLPSDCVLWVARDITARRRTEEALRSSEERYRLLALATNDAVWEWDCSANTLTWNDAIRTLFGYGSLDRGGDLSLDPAWWDERVHPEDRERVLTTFDAVLAEGDEVWRDEYRFRLADGRYASVLDCAYIARDSSGRPVRAIGAMIDVSERRELESRLRQSQKLEALGRIAAGIAHDFNNIIAAIRCSAELLLLDLAEGDTRRDDASEIVRVAMRGAALTKQILAFGRRQELHPRRVELNTMLDGLTPMLERLIAAATNCTGTIALETILTPDLPDLRVDPTQLEQVVTNLVVNSRDAMPAGGTITIETTLEEGRDGDRWVVLAVRDTGVGISDEVRAHIFEPFFTTKGAGKGAGLGLATAYGIVEQSGGSLTCESAPDQGATFRVHLPTASTAHERTTRHTPPSSIASESRDTVLVVDDEPTVRSAVTRYLERLGYQVVSAASAEEALAVIEHAPDRVRLLLTDVVMTGMNGRELAARAVVIRPALPVILMSGYSGPRSSGAFAAPAETSADALPLLQKPFDLDALESIVRETLAAAT